MFNLIVLFVTSLLWAQALPQPPKPRMDSPPLPAEALDATPKNVHFTAAVAEFDDFMKEHSAQADIVVTPTGDPQAESIRLRYAPDGWGFDAPKPTETQLLPGEMFSDSNLIWTLTAHEPRNEEEKGACGDGPTYFQEAAGSKTKINPYVKVPGNINDVAVNERSLRCLILTSWYADSGRFVGPCRIAIVPPAEEVDFTVVYKFEAASGVPRNIVKVHNPYLPDEDFQRCISHWTIPPMPHGYAEFRHERKGGWTSMTVREMFSPG